MQVSKIFLAILLLCISACNKDTDTELVDYSNTIKEIIDSDPQYSFFKELYLYTDSLSAYNPDASVKPSLVGPSLGSRYITAFIPNNDAFINSGITFIRNGDSFNPKLLNLLTFSNPASITPALIRRFLLYSIYNKKLDVKALRSDTAFVMLGFTVADSLFIKKSGGKFLLNAKADINVSSMTQKTNGILYTVNALNTPPLQNSNFISTTKADTSLSLFVQAYTRANNAAFNSSASTATIYCTVFAPTNAAFRAAGLNETTIAQQTPAYLTSIVNHHVIRTRFFTTDMTDGPITMLDGKTIDVSKNPTITLTSGAQRISANLIVTNIVGARSIINTIDKVLLP